LLVLLFAGCDFPGQPKAGQRPVPAEDVVSFDVLYGRNCSGCHGADGRLGPAPPLNDPLFLSIVPDEMLARVIRDGRPGTLMPAFEKGKGGALTVAQVHVLAGGLKPRWKPAGAKSMDVPPYEVAAGGKAADSTAALERGSGVYSRACADCHGAKGEGSSAGAIADPAFLALISDQALRRLIITGRTDLGMPNYAQTDGRDDNFRPLTSAEIDDLVAFLRHLGQEAPATARQDRSPHPTLRRLIAANARRALR
jgi:cytochrome c oxidase cbb3-type subunit III